MPIEKNKKAWNIAAPHFYGEGVLPTWGALGEGSDSPNLIGEIEGKIFLELGCGSGHSIKYLLENGATKVYGIDFSEKQMEFAKELNRVAIDEGSVELICSSMEMKNNQLVGIVDTVFSVYGVGWAQDLDKTLENVFSYIKPDGRFIFSFENPLFTRSLYNKETGNISLDGSPYEDYTKKLDNWFGTDAIVTCRLASTWINAAIRHGFVLIRYLEPRPMFVNTEVTDLVTYYDWEKAQKIPPIFIMEFKKLQ